LGTAERKVSHHNQGFPAELSTEEDLRWCQQYERAMLSDIFRRILHLEEEALEVSDEQVITQAIKALLAR
jgi:hypothetical protein